MNASDVGLIIVTVALLLCLRRRRCGVDAATRQAQNELLMQVETERKPQA